MRIYEHTQPGTLVRVALGAVLVFIVAVSAAFGVANPLALAYTAPVFLILFACLVLFHSLTVEVTTTEVRLRFGPGPIRKSFSLESIQEAEAVRNRWWYGWGIRLTPHGWLYNVSGFDAVEIRLADGKRCRIGTDDPHGLIGAIREAKGYAKAAG